jgi:hypothetical protein
MLQYKLWNRLESRSISVPLQKVSILHFLLHIIITQYGKLVDVYCIDLREGDFLWHKMIMYFRT